jgi:hypothetical protein
MKVGAAFGTPTSFCQFLATSPTPASAISSRKAITITADTRPTRSVLKRRQAACHTPSLCSTVASPGAFITALI